MNDEILKSDQEIDGEEFEATGSEEESLAEKVKRIKEKLKQCREEKAKYLENWQRAQADFINYRKMQEERNAEYKKYAKQGLLRELLLVIDTLEAAAVHIKEVNVIKMQMSKILKENGVEEIKAMGEKFDPHLHEAIEHIESDKPDDEILEVVQKGYKLNVKILRVAIVKTSKFKNK